jgi:hypothetical protein
VLATFVSSSGIDAVTSRRVTWYTRSSGTDMELMRATCSADVPQATAIVMLADSFGIAGSAPTDLVHGPGGPNSAFCQSYTCSISITGSYTFDLTVARRNPDLTIGANSTAVPPAPVITGLTPRDAGLTLAWVPPILPAGTPPITSYEVDVMTGAAGPVLSTTTFQGSSVGADIGGLTNGTNYWVRVRAANVNGWSPYSTAGPEAPAIGPPRGPTVLTLVPGDRQITATWTAIPGAQNYRIYAQDRSGRELGPQLVAGSATTGTITGLTNGVEYFILVSVITATGEGERGDPAGPLRPFGVPPAPVRVLATPGDGAITLEWEIPQVSEDPYVNGNGRQIIGARVGIVQLTPANTVSYANLVYGFFNLTTNVNSDTAIWNSPTSVTITVPGIKNGEAYVGEIGLHASSDAGEAETGPRLASQPPYEGAPRNPGVVPSGAPGTPDDVFIWEIFETSQRVSLSFRLPDGGNDAGMDGLLNGAGIQRLRAQVQKNVPKGSGTWVDVPALTTTDQVGSERPLTYEERIISAIGPLEGGGTRYRWRMAVSNVAEPPGSPERWSAYSPWGGVYDVNNGAAGPANVTVSRPNGSFGTELNVSWTPPDGAILTYAISCRAPNGLTVSKTINAPATSTLMTGLTDGRPYSCTVQPFTSTGGGAIATSNNTAVAYGECLLVASEDTYIDDENGSTQGGNGDLNVARNGSWFEFGVQANRRALLKWNYGAACTNGQTMANSAYLTQAVFGVYINDGGTNRTHRVNLITSNWNNNTTWSGPSFGSSPGSWWANGNGWRTLDVLGQARTQKASPAANNGWLIRDDGGDAFAHYARYSSRENGNTGQRPRLDLRFYTQGP